MGGGGTSYTNGQNVTNLTTTAGATVTLHAKWTVNTYTVAYNANGGSGTMTSVSHTYGVAQDLTDNTFTRTGYTFSGWNTEMGGGGTSYTNGQNVTNLTAANDYTVTLYAQWTPTIGIGIIVAGVDALTFTNVPTGTVGPGATITLTISKGPVTEWYIEANDLVITPITLTNPPVTTEVTFNMPSAPGHYSVNVFATVNGIPYSGSFGLIVNQ
jgi:uncharacterized repeat protein (TIGR02543 family)